jgi:hypothetical protein
MLYVFTYVITDSDAMCSIICFFSFMLKIWIMDDTKTIFDDEATNFMMVNILFISGKYVPYFS